MTRELFDRIATDQNSIMISHISKNDQSGGRNVEFFYKGEKLKVYLPSKVFEPADPEKINFASFFYWALENPIQDDVKVILPMLELAVRIQRAFTFKYQP